MPPAAISFPTGLIRSLFTLLCFSALNPLFAAERPNVTVIMADDLGHGDLGCYEATAVIGKWHLGLGDPKPDWNGQPRPGPLEIGFDHCHLLPTTNDRVPQVYVHDHRVLNLDPKDPLWVGDRAPDENHPTGITRRDTLRMNWTHGHNQTIHNGIGRIGFYTGGNAARFRDEDLGDEWVKRSNTWIEAHQKEPFFLFFASHGIHVPRMPHERFQGKTTLGFRGDVSAAHPEKMKEMIAKMDEIIAAGRSRK